MMWRKFGADNYHGIISSTNGIDWTRVKDDVLKCTGDMNVLVDPFGDGLVYITPGGDHLPWWTSDGSNDFTVWKKSGLTVGSIFGNSRIQELNDTKKYHQLAPVQFEGVAYRFIAFCEDWNRMPKPDTVDMRTQPLGVIGENLAAFAPARDANVKLLLMDGCQRPRRCHDQHFVHSFALGGV